MRQLLVRWTWLAVFLVVYVPNVGRGFIKDDFGWILDSHVRHAYQLKTVARGGTGFFRPVVAASFTINERIFKGRPRGYGLTNVALALAVAFGIYRLAMTLGAGNGPAMLAAAVWLLNIHGIYWSLLWISGRTSLLATLGCVFAADYILRNRLTPALLWLTFAFFAKEEALAMGFVLVLWTLWLPAPSTPRRQALTLAAGVAASLGVYLLLRQFAGAMTPLTAPSEYRFTLNASHLWVNIGEYLDRAATPSFAVMLFCIVALGLPRLVGQDWRRIGCAAAWFIGGFALTVFLPVRSDLYAVLPSVGACLAAALVVDRAWAQASSRGRVIAATACVVAPLLLAPVLIQRSGRWVDLADFSTRVLTDLDRRTANVPEDETVTLTLVDDQSTRVNIASAIGPDVSKAFHLWTDRTATIVVR